jgi:hypothetical protein
MAREMTIKLAFGCNLIMGNAPDKITLDKLHEKLVADPQAVESFGLFDSNTSNYNTYYPDVTAEDLAPKENEFIQPVFRALSEVVVHKDINPVDFSRNKVLHKSLGLLRGATVNADHETAIGNAMGAVKDVMWEESYKTPGGIVIPSGINARMKLDGKSHPRVARAIMMDPPSIHSTSVTVQFLWEMSHNLSQEEFFKKLGTFDKDGKQINRVASLVKRYHELSLVGHGADPYAQKVNKEGQINNPTWADVSYNSINPVERKATNFFFFDFKSDLIANSEETIPTESNTDINNNNMNKKFLLALAMVMGLKNKVNDVEAEFTEETITEDVVTNAVARSVNSVNSLSARPEITTDEVTRLKGVETEYNKIKGLNNTELLAFRESMTNTLRAEVTKNLGIATNGKPSPEIVALIAKAEYDTLVALNAQYKVDADKNFPLSCTDCGSSKVTRASAKTGEAGDGTPSDKKNLSLEEVQDVLRQRKAKEAFKIHGQEDGEAGKEKK